MTNLKRPRYWDDSFFRSTEKQTRSGSWVYDPESDSFEFSPNFQEMTGTAAGATARDLENNIAPFCRELFRQHLSGAVEHHPLVSTMVLIRNDQALYYTQTVVAIDVNGRKLVYGTWGPYGGDEQKNILSMIPDASIDGMIVLDPDLNVTLWNARMEEMTGIARSEATGKKLPELMPASFEALEVQEAIGHARMGLGYFLPAANTAGGYYEEHYLPLKDAGGAVTGILVIRHDVSHRVKAENELKDLNSSLEAKNKTLNQRNAELQVFSHITSHEFKEPLRKIYTVLEMTLTQEAAGFTERGRQYFKQMQAAVQRIGLLADDIASYSRLDDERAAFRDVNLQDVFDLVLKRLDEPITLSGAVITASSLPMYRGHRLMLIQLFQHLLGNAVKFQEAGHQPIISVTAMCVSGAEVSDPRADENASYLKLDFADNGIGFKRKYRERIFDVFMRIGGNRFPGNGTGLALCQKIAGLHGGFITAESNPGEGSVFSCFLEQVS